MKKALLIVLAFISVTAYSQRYRRSDGTPLQKPIAVSNIPSGMGYYYDTLLFKFRPFQSTAEVLSFYPNLPDRQGSYTIYVKTGGTLSSGVITGGVLSKWWFKNGTADSNLVVQDDYNFLTNKPTIPAAQVQSDWNASSGLNAIANKPTIPVIPPFKTVNGNAITGTGDISVGGLLNGTPAAKNGVHLEVNSTNDSIIVVNAASQSDLAAAVKVKTLAGSSILGDVYNKSTGIALSDFIVNGATANVVNGKIQLSGGAGDFTKSIDLPNATNLEHWKMRLKYTEITASGAPLAIGLRSINGVGQQYGVATFVYNSAVGHEIRTLLNTGNTTQSSSSTAIPNGSGNQYEITIEQNGAVITSTARNVTQGGYVDTIRYTFSTGTPSMPNTATFSIFSLLGVYQIDEFEVTNKEIVNATLCFLGDSKTKGYTVDSFSHRYASLLNNYYGNVIVSAGSSDRTTEVIQKLPEIIAMRPANVGLWIGTNNLSYGGSEVALEADYDTIVARLQRSGIKVYCAINPPQTNGIDFTALNNHVRSKYTNLLNLGVLPLSDGTHPNTVAQITIADSIINQIGVAQTTALGSKADRSDIVALAAQIAIVGGGVGIDGVLAIGNTTTRPWASGEGTVNANLSVFGDLTAHENMFATKGKMGFVSFPENTANSGTRKRTQYLDVEGAPHISYGTRFYIDELSDGTTLPSNRIFLGTMSLLDSVERDNIILYTDGSVALPNTSNGAVTDSLLTIFNGVVRKVARATNLVIFLNVEAYADVAGIVANPNAMIEIKVASDNRTGSVVANTIYQLWPDNTLIAVTGTQITR